MKSSREKIGSLLRKPEKKLKTTCSHAAPCTNITQGDPASMQTPAPKMDSRVKHGNDRKWRGVMPPCVLFKLLHGVMRHPSMKKVKGQKSKVKSQKKD
ncbi:MAG: hypothetical protein ISR54_08410 [Chlorobium phaeobacteroides]|nr:hypothetical protein [Chlorobium phaeobacteroides]